MVMWKTGCRCNLNWLKLVLICLSEKNMSCWGTRKDMFPIFFLSVFLGISSMLLSNLVFVICALLFPSLLPSTGLFEVNPGNWAGGHE